MDAAGCRQEGRKECFVDIRGRIVLAILVHFGTSSVVHEQVGIIVVELPIASCIAQNVPAVYFFITAEKSGVARAKSGGEKEKECTTERKSRRRRDEKDPWALNYGSEEGGGVEKGRRRGGENRVMYV